MGAGGCPKEREGFQNARSMSSAWPWHRLVLVGTAYCLFHARPIIRSWRALQPAAALPPKRFGRAVLAVGE
jgi:hypothetical protein